MTESNLLLTAGCSFTQQQGWANMVQQQCGYRQLKNLAIGGSSNDTQINRVNDFVLSRHDPFDMIWQVTFLSRINLRLPIDHPDVVNKRYMPKKDQGFTYAEASPVANLIDGTRHVDVLYDEYVWRHRDLGFLDVNNELARLLCAMLLAKKLASRFMVFFAANDVDERQSSRVQEFFARENITSVPYKDNLLDWTQSRNLPLAADGFHPAQSSYESYAAEVIIPAFLSVDKA